MPSFVLLFPFGPHKMEQKQPHDLYFVQCQNDNCRAICHILWLSVHRGECQNVWVETILVWAMGFWALEWLAGLTVWPLPGLSIFQSHAPPWTHPRVICNVLRGPIFHWPFVNLLVNISWSGFLPTGWFPRALGMAQGLCGYGSPSCSPEWQSSIPAFFRRVEESLLIT